MCLVVLYWSDVNVFGFVCRFFHWTLWLCMIKDFLHNCVFSPWSLCLTGWMQTVCPSAKAGNSLAVLLYCCVILCCFQQVISSTTPLATSSFNNLFEVGSCVYTILECNFYMRLYSPPSVEVLSRDSIANFVSILSLVIFFSLLLAILTADSAL